MSEKAREIAETIEAMWRKGDIDADGEVIDQAVAPLVEALEGFEAAKDLWLPEIADTDNEGEVAALHALRNKYLKALKGWKE